MSKVIFNNSNNLFYQSLKNEVDNYFISNRIKKTGDWRLHSKTLILISTAVILYSSLLLFHPPAWLALLSCVMLGFTLACIGFSVMHDANHGSYSTKAWVNNLLGLTINAMGASSYFWKQKHNIIHHTYTNVDGLDDDIAKSPIIRQCKSQRWVPAHRIQHLYLLPVYALSTLFWIFTMDFRKYFTGRIYTTTAWKMSAWNHVVFWITKIGYVIFYIVLPVAAWGFLPWLAGYLLLNAAMGLTLSLVFQLAHVVENTAFETVAPDEEKQIDSAWAEHELRTTSNFAMHNACVSWLVGGLNFQIEHHLFPRISHIHYPAISHIVMRKCKEFNLPYHHYDSLTAAVGSHFRVMRELGRAA